MRDTERRFDSHRLITVWLAAWAIFHLAANFFGFVSAIKLRAYHAMFLVSTVFLTCVKPKKLGIALALGSIAVFAVFIAGYTDFALSGKLISTPQMLLAGVMLALIFTAGLIKCRSLAILGLVFVAYNFFGALIPGVLGHGGFTVRRVLSTMIWGSQGVFGVGAGVSVSYIFMFVLFGAFLKRSGFTQLIGDLALALVGSRAGGQAKIAVLSSAVMGMINGSAVANVAATGTVTIPMMKKSGYSGEYAAAVEAAASTGGQFMPPVMGAVGFVMAEFMGQSYTKVMLAAVIPALLYYTAIFLSVHFEAKKLGLSGAAKENLPAVRLILRERGHMFLPLVTLIVLMALRFTPLYACGVSMLVTVLAAQSRKTTRMSAGDILAAVEDAGMSCLGVGVCCLIIGTIIGTVTLTSLGLSFGQLLLGFAGDGKLLLCGALTMLMSVILGMGVPGVAAYVIVSSVAVQPLISAGAQPMAAHMFCLIYACLANITPPVAISSYTAAGIAGADQAKTSFIAMRLGLAGFVMPFFFLQDPVLLLGSPAAGAVPVIGAVLSAIVGTVCLVFALEGMAKNRCGAVTRLAFALSALLCMKAGLKSDAIGYIIAGSALIYNVFGEKE